MSEIICHHEGVYNIYDTVFDCFIFKNGVGINLLKVYIGNEYGSSGLRGLDSRLERAHSCGHSAILGGTLEEFLCCNRAGKDKSFLTTEECISQFLSLPNKKEDGTLTKKSQKTQRKKRKRKERKRNQEFESTSISDAKPVNEEISKDNSVKE